MDDLDRRDPVVQVHCFSANILRGLFWFLFQSRWSFATTRWLTLRDGLWPQIHQAAFLGELSPNKTWEGFIGGGICTVIFAFLSAPLYPTFTICPCESSASWAASLSAAMRDAHYFIAESYRLPGGSVNRTVSR